MLTFLVPGPIGLGIVVCKYSKGLLWQWASGLGQQGDVVCLCLAGFGRKEVVEYLLENGADVNIHDDGTVLFSSLGNICRQKL